jgi:hypothetical protein
LISREARHGVSRRVRAWEVIPMDLKQSIDSLVVKLTGSNALIYIAVALAGLILLVGFLLGFVIGAVLGILFSP